MILSDTKALDTIQAMMDEGAANLEKIANVLGSTGRPVERRAPRTIDIVFDGPPGPVPGRFVEVEDTETGASIGVGRWVDLATEGNRSGLWALRLNEEDVT